MKLRVLCFSFLLFNFLFANVISQTFSIRGGLNISDLVLEVDGEKVKDAFEPSYGFHIGGTMAIPINDYFSFETGLLFTSRGAIADEEGVGYSYTDELRLHYLDIPITIKGMVPLSEGADLFWTAGPYIGIGLYGHEIHKDRYDGDNDESTSFVRFGLDKGYDLKPLNLGLTFGLGIDISHYIVGVSYDLGLTNIIYMEESNDPLVETIDVKFQNRTFKVSLGYRF